MVAVRVNSLNNFKYQTGSDKNVSNKILNTRNFAKGHLNFNVAFSDSTILCAKTCSTPWALVFLDNRRVRHNRMIAIWYSGHIFNKHHRPCEARMALAQGLIAFCYAISSSGQCFFSNMSGFTEVTHLVENIAKLNTKRTHCCNCRLQ